MITVSQTTTMATTLPSKASSSQKRQSHSEDTCTPVPTKTRRDRSGIYNRCVKHLRDLQSKKAESSKDDREFRDFINKMEFSSIDEAFEVVKAYKEATTSAGHSKRRRD